MNLFSSRTGQAGAINIIYEDIMINKTGVRLAVFSGLICSAHIAFADDNVTQQIQVLNNQIQAQLKTMQAAQQKQLKDLNLQIQNQLKTMQTTLEQQIKQVHEENKQSALVK